MASLGGTKLVLCFRTRCGRRSLVQVNPRIIVATVAVAVAASIFSLVAAPLLSLLPVDTAHAQDGPSIDIEFGPSHKIRMGEELNFTLNFSGLSSHINKQGLTYDVNVVSHSRPDFEVCEGTGTGTGMSMGTISGATMTKTGTIPNTCPARTYALIVTLYDGGDELVTAVRAFKVEEYRTWELPSDNRPNTPAGIWAEQIYSDDRRTTRFHVVDSTTKKVYVYDLPDMDDGRHADSLSFVTTYDLGGTSNPWGITGNASTTYVTSDGSSDGVFAYSNADRSVRVSDDEFTLDSANSAPRGIQEVTVTVTGDFRQIYVVDNDEGKIFYYQYDERAGITSFTHAPEEDYPLDPENADPTGFWQTGWLMYVADDEDDKIYAYEMDRRVGRTPQYDVEGLARKGNTDVAGIWSDFIWMYVVDSVDMMIYAYRYPKTPFEPVTVTGSSAISVEENSTTTDEDYEGTEPDPVRNASSTYVSPQLGVYGLQSDDRLFSFDRGTQLSTSTSQFELLFREGRWANFEDPVDADKDNVYDLIIRGSTRGFPFAFFPVKVTITDVIGEQPSFASSTATRNVAEGERTGRWIRPAIEAINPDKDELFYTLTGDDEDSFELEVTSTTTVYIKTTTALDHSATPTYSVRVNVRDSEDSTGATSTAIDDWIDVTINVFEGPEVSGLSQVSYAENGTQEVTQFTATNPGGGTIEWSLEGDDAGDFTIDEGDGMLRFALIPDYENPVDDDPDNIYEITVVARAGSLRGDLAVTVTVTDVNEAPSFSDGSSTSRNVDEGAETERPVGAPVTATDEDRNPSDTLTYSLSGTDASSFDIDSSTGQIQTKDALDFESEDTYIVTVDVRDSRDTNGDTDTQTDDTIDVTINVQGVNDPPDAERLIYDQLSRERHRAGGDVHGHRS